jgi:hypothetical protein
MRFKAYRYLILVGVIALMFSGVGRADLLYNCGTCQGSTYLLEYDPTPVNLPNLPSGVTVWDIFLTIDATGYNGVAVNMQAYIQDVAIKVANSADSGHSSLQDAPGGVPGLWTLEAGGLNAKGCDGKGSGFLCAKDSTTAPVRVSPALPIYTWEFYYATHDPLFTGEEAATIKAEYVDGQGKKVGALVSEDITLQARTIPDGGVTLMLLGGALIGLETLRRRLRA